jgi:glycosyltransferase involved in cell wall biosynthesis
MDKFKVSVILPCSNEEKNVPLIAERLIPILEKYNDYEILFVNDGSRDNTLEEIKKLAQQNTHIKYISFSRNFMHQNALRAGLKHATGDAVICMDADLQQPPDLIPEMVRLWNEEKYDIVYTLRRSTGKESFFKRFTANFFYWLINRVSNIGLENGAADFRLMDRVAVDALNEYGEAYIFYRGIVSSMGFKKIALPYEVAPRIHGKSQYTLKKMINLSLSGITGFSTFPLQLSTFFGILISGLSFLYAAYAVVIRLISGDTVPGWSSLLFGIFFLGGIQLLMIGILGEYVGKIFFEIKKRPNYIIKETNI